MSNTNSGYHNSGYHNSGNCNYGSYNSGHRNSGSYNSGDRNSGDRNSGNRNSGTYNSGDRNSGYHNSGNRNSGTYNSGDRNSGYRNSGDCNSGVYNSGDHNSGFFCTETPYATFFDEPTNLSYVNASGLIPHVDLPDGVKWIPTCEMTDVEKHENPDHVTTGGYLQSRVLPLTESFPVAWGKMSEVERNKWTSLPNFDAAKFLEITGVDIREKKRREVIIDGSSVSISEDFYRVLKQQQKRQR